MNKQQVIKNNYIAGKIEDLDYEFNLDIENILVNLFPLPNESFESPIEKIKIRNISDFTGIFLTVDVYDKKYITKYDLFIEPIEKKLEVNGPDSLYYDVYKIENNKPKLEKRVFNNKEMGITIIKRYTNKGNDFLKRNIGKMAYQTYEYVFMQNDFKAIIEFNLEDKKDFDEEKFINSLLNLEIIVTNIDGLKNIIMILSYLGIIPDNEGFYDIVPIKSNKVKKKVK